MFDGNPGVSPASLPVMRSEDEIRSRSAGEVESRALWVLMAAGLFLLAAAALSGESGPTVSRTDRFQATLAPGATVRVENVNGDVVASRGSAFSAVVTTNVTARDRSRAEEILNRTKILQSNEGSDYELKTDWPEASGHRHGRSICRDCRIASRYELTIPPGISVDLQTVNGEVRVQDVDGNLEAQSVNGNVLVAGARRSVQAQTVNGRVEAVATVLAAASAWKLETVNGSVVATLPKNAKFDWSASTLSGTIASTFPLPPAREELASAPPAPRAPRVRASATSDEEGADLVDTEEISREIDESLREAEVEVHSQNKTVREVRVLIPGRRYEAKVGGGGPRFSTTSLNGDITLLAAGTNAAEAKPLVSGHRAVTVTIPPVEVRMPDVVVRIPKVRVVSPHPPTVEPEPDEPDDDQLVRGDISGDFLSNFNGSYRVGNVSGRVRILTHAGEVTIASAGNGAEIKTFGGDIRMGPVKGDLKAHTLAGDVRVGAVAGSATLETSGGDIRVDRIGGAASARTGGGDIVLLGVAGGVTAETGGGEVRIMLLGRQAKGGVTIRNAGGDVLLTLPSDFQADVDLEVEDTGETEDTLIRSDFPGVAITRGDDLQRASGLLNGGGPRLLVRTSSGSIRLRKGPSTAP